AWYRNGRVEANTSASRHPAPYEARLAMQLFYAAKFFQCAGQLDDAASNDALAGLQIANRVASLGFFELGEALILRRELRAHQRYALEALDDGHASKEGLVLGLRALHE